MKLPKTPDAGAEPKKPKTLWETVVSSTPVVMTVIATLLAGLSNSELTQSLVYRGQAAQNQAKAADQWGLFQAKKARGAGATTTVEQMQIAGDISALTAEGFSAVAEHLAAKVDSMSAGKLTSEQTGKLKETIAANTAGVKEAIATLNAPLPGIGELSIADANLRKVFETVKKDPMEEDTPLYGNFPYATLREALRAADQLTRADDEALKPVTDAVKKIQHALDALAASAIELRRATTQAVVSSQTLGASDRQSPAELRQLAGDFTAARLRFDAARYDREAKLNQQVAYLFEVSVRKANWQAERHRTRSKYFFYGMLAAQAAVMIATFSLAVRERSWMWSVAASIGVIAVSYAGYVYLFT